MENTLEVLLMDQRRAYIIEAMASGEVRKNSWGWAVCEYLLEHPEDAEEMATHHYRSYLEKKQQMAVQDLKFGRHLNKLVARHIVRERIRVYSANN